MAANMFEIPELDSKGLREFGLVTGAIVVALFGLFFPWILDLAFPLWPWILGGVLAAWALLAPATLRTLYRVWMKFGLQLSRVTTPIILGIVYYLVIFPAGLIMRLGKRDPMARKFDEAAPSYRVKSHKAAKSHLERPF